MHSEHLGNLHPGWIIGGWLIAVATTSVVYLSMVGVGLFPEAGAAVFGVALAMAAGFFVGGLFVGLRWMDAPILHGAAITLVSLLVWFLGSLALPGNALGWSNSAPSALGLLLLQLAASSAGGWTGRRISLGGSEADATPG